MTREKAGLRAGRRTRGAIKIKAAQRGGGKRGGSEKSQEFPAEQELPGVEAGDAGESVGAGAGSGGLCRQGGGISDFWVLQQELKADIARRGLTVTDDRGRQTENRSVSLAVQVSRQMMALFNAMGFKTSDFVEAGDGDVL